MCATDNVAETTERTAQPRVAPGWVVCGEPDHQFLSGLRRGRPTSTAFAAAVVFGGDELSVPAQERVRGEQRGDIWEDLAPKEFAPHGEATPLVVGEPKPTAAKLLARN